jgi:hypothetical protein
MRNLLTLTREASTKFTATNTSSYFGSLNASAKSFKQILVKLTKLSSS